jgi:hypothetical protein
VRSAAFSLPPTALPRKEWKSSKKRWTRCQKYLLKNGSWAEQCRSPEEPRRIGNLFISPTFPLTRNDGAPAI